MVLSEVVNFIEKCEPSFRKNGEGKFIMFTVATQHVKADTIEELLEHGIIECAERDGKSAFRAMFEKLECEGAIRNE